MPRKAQFQRKIDVKGKNKGGGLPLIQQDSILPPAIRLIEAPDTLIYVSQGIVRSTQAPLAYVVISWQEAPNIAPDYYNVEWSESSLFTDVQRKRANDLSATIENLKINTTYYFRVQAVQGGAYSEYSETLSVLTLPDLTVPPNVTGLSASFVKSDLLISWTKPISEVFKDIKILIYNAAHSILYATLYSASQQIIWSAEENLVSSGGVGLTSVSVDVISRSWSNVESSPLNTTTTAAIPTTPTGIQSNWIGDNGRASADVIVSWLAVDNANSYDISLDSVLYKTNDTRFTYPYNKNVSDHTPTLASGDPNLSYLLYARDKLNQVSIAASGTLVNTAPSGSLLSLSTVSGFSQIAAQVSLLGNAIIHDFDHYEWALVSGAVTYQQFISSTPDVIFLCSGSGSYQVSVKAFDKFNQASSAILSSVIVIDALTISELRAETSYTDSVNNTETTLNVLKDGLGWSGTNPYVTYAASTSWRWVKATRPLIDRYKTITLGYSQGAGGTFLSYYKFDDGKGNIQFASGPVTVSGAGAKVLTLYSSEASAIANAIDLSGSHGTVRYDLPSIIEARFITLYFKATVNDLLLYEFYPRRLVQSDDIEAETIKGINIAASTITADKISVINLQAVSANMGALHMDGVIDIVSGGGIYQGSGSFASPTTGLKIFNSSGVGKLSTYNTGVEQITLDTDGKFKAGAGNVLLDANGITLIARSFGESWTAAAQTIQWKLSGTYIGGIEGYNDSAGAVDIIRIQSNLSRASQVNVAGRDAIVLQATNLSTSATITIERSPSKITLDASTINITGGVNVGTATGAGAGQIATSGNIGIGYSPTSNARIYLRGVDATSSNYSFYVDNSTPTALFYVRNDGYVFSTSLYTNNNIVVNASLPNSVIAVTETNAAGNTLAMFTGEPGVAFNQGVLGYNYYPLNGGASGRPHTGVGGSFIRFTEGGIALNTIDSAGTITNTFSTVANRISFFGVATVVKQTGGAATADLTYDATERDMINRMYTALRNYGLLT